MISLKIFLSRRYIFKSIFAPVIIFLSVQIGSADVLTLQPGPEANDAFTCDCMPNTTNPNGPITLLYQGRYTVCTNTSLMQWDLSALPENSFILYAGLELYCCEFFGAVQGQMSFNLITGGWSESGVTHNTLPVIDPAYEVLTGWPTANSWHTVDITNIVQAWTDGIYANRGIRCCYTGCSNTCDVQFASSDYTYETYRPKITIYYAENSVKRVEGQSPIDFSFKGNFPNPFNANTQFEFSVPGESHVSLNIFNSKGEHIVRLVNSTLGRGNYISEFNAENLPTGIYFAKFSASDFNEIRKVVLVK